MTQRLHEWATNKAGEIADRVYGLLSKYTSVKFKVRPVFVGYKNKWGSFMGRVAYGSNGRFYRLNFLLGGGSMEIVSMDVWAKGAIASKTMPQYTCSLEGFGITKVITYLKDFVATPEQCLTENVVTNGYDASLRLNENTQENVEWTAEFIASDPLWQQAWASGNVDEKQYHKAFMTWVKAQGRTFSGARGPTKLEVMNATKKGLKGGTKSVAAQVGMSPQAAAQVAQGAASVPSVAVAPSSAGGPQVEFDVSDIASEKITFDQIQQAMGNDAKGPLTAIQDMHDEIVVLHMSDHGKLMLWFWGKGGIGKSFTLENTMLELGLMLGSGWVKLEKGSKECESPGALKNWLIKQSNAGVTFIVVDDNDPVMKRPTNLDIWKQVTDPKPHRELYVTSDDTKDKKNGLKAGSYPFNCKFIVLSNTRPSQLLDDPQGAMFSRLKPVQFEFTEQQVLAYIATFLKGMPEQYCNEVTEEEMATIFNMYWKASLFNKQHGLTKRSFVSFRDFNTAVGSWWDQKVAGFKFDSWLRRNNPISAILAM